MTTTPVRASNGTFTKVTGTSDTDWASLEQVEFEKLSDVWNWCKLGAKTAGESGLVIVQAMPDFHIYMRDISPMHGDRKARRVTRKLGEIVNKFTGIKNDFERIPNLIRKVYEEEILAANRKGKKRIDLTQ